MGHSKKLFVAFVAAVLCVSVLAVVTVAGALITGSTGSVIRLSSPPTSVRLNALENATQVYAFDEAQNVTLAAPVAVDATAAGTYSTFPSGNATIAANTVVDSHLIHSDIPSRNPTTHRTGSVTFGGNILGVIASTARLVASDSALGVPGTLYERNATNPTYTATSLRGLESSAGAEPGSLGGDKFTITGKTVSFDLNTLVMDEIRVITVHTNPLATTVSDTPDPVQAGSNVTYTVTVANNGSFAASNVQMQDQFPGTFVSATAPVSCAPPGANTVTCTLGTIAAGGSAQATIVVKSPSTVPAGGTISDTASSPPGQTPATAITTVVSPRLATSITDSPDPVQAGDSVTYAVKVTNNGSAVADATVSDTLPAGTTLKLPLPAGCSGTGPVTCDLGPLAGRGCRDGQHHRDHTGDPGRQHHRHGYRVAGHQHVGERVDDRGVAAARHVDHRQRRSGPSGRRRDLCRQGHEQRQRGRRRHVSPTPCRRAPRSSCRFRRVAAEPVP